MSNSRCFQSALWCTSLLILLFASMAPARAASSLPTLRPDGDEANPGGCLNNSGATSPLWDRIDDDPDAPDTADYVRNPRNASAKCFVTLTNVPEDFSTLSSLSVTVDVRNARFKDDGASLWIQAWDASKAEPLTRSARVATRSTTGRVDASLELTAASHDRARWNGALLALEWRYSVVRRADNGQLRLTAIELNGSYEPVPPAPKPQCSDGLDNDGDGRTDYPNDPGCAAADDTSESPDPSAGTTTYLSDLEWSSMTNGWGPAEKDRSNGDQAAGDGGPITLNGVTYQKGLGTHADADVRYNLGGVCTTFESDLGLDDFVDSYVPSQGGGTVVFEVWADGSKLYDSGLVTTDTPTKSVRLDVTDKKELALVVGHGGDNIDNDHADWAAARVTCSSTPPAPDPDPTPPPDPDPTPPPASSARGQSCDTYTKSLPAGGREIVVAQDGTGHYASINAAAQVATAGDVVTIKSGTYDEGVHVAGSGTSSAPIVFQAATCGQVVLTGTGNSFMPAGWQGDNTGAQNVNPYVTVKGLNFRQFGSASSAFVAVRASTGWRIEDVAFDHAGYEADVNVRGHDVTITETTSAYSGRHSFVGAGGCSSSCQGDDPLKLHGVRVTSSLIHHANQRNTTIGDSASVKFLFTHGAIVDNVESYENCGPGWWFDGWNTAYVIRNSYFHHNRGCGQGLAGGGAWLELESNGGLVENNVFEANEGEGLGLWESHDVEVRNNEFRGGSAQILFRQVCCEPRTLPHNSYIHHNRFLDWREAAMYAFSDGYKPAPSDPRNAGTRIDYNTYRPGTGPYLYWLGRAAHSLQDMRNFWGYEQNGTQI